jgi:hypothetical protein
MATQNLRSFRKHQSPVLFHPERDEIEAIFLPKLVLTCGEVSFNSIFKIIFREEYTYPMNWHLIRIYLFKLPFVIFDPLKLPFHCNQFVVLDAFNELKKKTKSGTHFVEVGCHQQRPLMPFASAIGTPKKRVACCRRPECLSLSPLRHSTAYTACNN